MFSAALLCLVIGIADGDTLTARCQTPDGASKLAVRLAQIDAPEKRQPFGDRSRQHLASLCFKRPAQVRPQGADRYGRTIARVVCDSADASLEQVRAGMAWAYRPYLTDAAIGGYEREARHDRRGLWADPSPVPPWIWRSARRHRPDVALDTPSPTIPPSGGGRAWPVGAPTEE